MRFVVTRSPVHSCRNYTCPPLDAASRSFARPSGRQPQGACQLRHRGMGNAQRHRLTVVVMPTPLPLPTSCHMDFVLHLSALCLTLKKSDSPGGNGTTYLHSPWWMKLRLTAGKMSAHYFRKQFQRKHYGERKCHTRGNFQVGRMPHALVLPDIHLQGWGESPILKTCLKL